MIGESYEKGGEEKKGEREGRGSMGNRYNKSQKVILGRQREQECGCCPPFEGGVQSNMGEWGIGGGMAGLTQEAKI